MQFLIRTIEGISYLGTHMKVKTNNEAQTILITGGTSGIGEAMVRLFHGNGYNVWFTWMSGEKKAAAIVQDLSRDNDGRSETGAESGMETGAEAWAEDGKEAGAETDAEAGTILRDRKSGKRKKAQVKAFHLDLADPLSHGRLMHELPGIPDILINNAGLGTATVQKSTMDPDEQDRLLIGVNATGTLLLTRAVLSEMKKKDKGRIIFISSVGGGINVFPGFSLADGMSKAAVAFLGRQLAAETVQSGIRVFTICPGAIDTPMFASSTLNHLSEKERQKLIAGLPGGRLISPGEIASLALYLCGKASDILHGSVIDASLGLGVNPGTLQKL